MRRHVARLTGVALAGVLTLSGCAGLLPGSAPSPLACNPPPPADASPTAQAYAAATARALEARTELSDTIAAQDMMMSLDDMRTAATIDEAFLTDVRTIDFPPEVAGLAQDFILAVEADDAFLLAAASQDGYYGTHLDERERLHEQRFRASVALREALDLPPSGCRLNLP